MTYIMKIIINLALYNVTTPYTTTTNPYPSGHTYQMSG